MCTLKKLFVFATLLIIALINSNSIKAQTYYLISGVNTYCMAGTNSVYTVPLGASTGLSDSMCGGYAYRIDESTAVYGYKHRFYPAVRKVRLRVGNGEPGSYLFVKPNGSPYSIVDPSNLSSLTCTSNTVNTTNYGGFWILSGAPSNNYIGGNGEINFDYGASPIDSMEVTFTSHIMGGTSQKDIHY